MRKKKTYHITIWVLFILSLLALIYLAPKLTKPQYYSSDDFFPYWAAGKLNLSGDNPYDPENKDQLQIEVSGQPSNRYPISIMLNPPWAVTMVMPFGLLDYPLSRLAWLIFSIGCMVSSAQLNWRLFNGPTKQKWLAWIVILLFAPMISVLEVGQISALILLGLTLFLFFTTFRQNDWAAGAALVLIAIKPQVTLIFWIALLFWVIHQRRWIIVLSSVATALLFTLVAMLFNPQIIPQYFGMIQTGYLPELATPTIGAYLRFFWLGTDKFWLQFIPPLFGVFWFLYFWYKNHKPWSWMNELPILLLVSQVTAPYTYTYDQVILIPAIIQATIWLYQDWKRWLTLVLVLMYIAINILDLVLHMKLSDFWFIWMAPAFFIWFLYIRRQYKNSVEKISPPLPT